MTSGGKEEGIRKEERGNKNPPLYEREGDFRDFERSIYRDIESIPRNRKIGVI